ncbi:MAG: amidohydrolase family protein [Maribacter sp.]|jgi:imidazolonepropionase-like amidohydrolase
MKKIHLLLGLTLLISCGQSQKKKTPSATLIQKVTIVDVRSGELVENQQVVIDSGKIKSIDTSPKNASDYLAVIDGTGKYLMPGLTEMHAHIPAPTTSRERIEETLFLYVSNGITTIRGMLGHPLHLELREKAKTGELLSPRIFTSSPSLNGSSVTSMEEAAEKVTTYKNEGYDFLKIHPGIQLDIFDQIVKTANEVGIPFSGHVPVDVGIRHALESKYASIDHVDGFLEGLVPASKNVDPSENGFFGYAFTPLADTETIDELVQMANENEVWIVPTQSLFERWFAPITADELLKQPEMQYMQKVTLENWKNVKERYMVQEDFNPQQWQRFDSIRKQLIKKLSDNGHGMLLGSDAPQLFNVPGFSIHHEIQGMLGAGMKPIEILRSGTVNPAIFFNMQDVFGEVREGLTADLLLIDSNPLESLTALKQISGVFLKGEWISKVEIDEKLKVIAENAAKN